MQFPPASVNQFFRTYQITQFAVSDDETRLYFNTNMNGTMNIWALDLPDGFPYLYGATGQSASFIQPDPEGRFTAAALDDDGDENYQLYALPPEGGSPSLLFDTEEGEKHFVHEIRSSGDVYFASNKEQAAVLSGFRKNIFTGETEKLFEGAEGATFIKAVSPDGQKTAVTELRSNSHLPAYVVHGDVRKPLSMNPEGVHSTGDAVFVSNDALYMTSNEGGEFHDLWYIDLHQGTRKRVMQLSGENVEQLKWHEESGSLLIQTSKGVRDYLYLRSRDGSVEQLEAPVDVIEQISLAKSGAVYVLGMKAVDPVNIYKYERGTWKKITKNEVPGMKEEQLTAPKTVQYESFDGRKIEALWFQAPADADNGHVIFWPHGGPQAAERSQYRAVFQCFLNEGYSIFAPNFRGSTGYGASFMKLVEQDWGGGPRKDCVAGIEWLFDQGYCDPGRLFLIGGSYGGYMALLLAGRHSGYFRAVVDIFGVSNLFTFIESVPDHWKPVMASWLGDPVKDEARLQRDSPVTYLSSMQQPMLIIQGANDPRVVKEESDQIADALKRQGTKVDYLVLDDEGHGFSKKENEVKVYKRILGFLREHQQSSEE
ncbi:S9 family peptidase [Alkalicoccus chagannorensis]|uniref:S9 family peptidase n=1 Tax=Alkalicoccus chagannorensis TaxID=427072 RepID=UPI00041ABE94|nr:S9 family peptidase [Alkalicoccus chagannorensis]